MEANKEQLQVDVRYAQRLCERTARFYRRIQTSLTFLTMLAGSGAIAALSARMPAISTGLGIAFAICVSINMAVRPADHIAANDADVRKYAALLAKAHGLDAAALAGLLSEARLSDTAEIEPLRAVAYNDVMLEIDRPDALIELGRFQKFLGALA
ncbi:hypothetical protein [Rugamonas sp.]|uniref:hypothetical protein n=1 Tax=Rugamonas sp. TaxID=1926287 RepID=UPI0025FAAA92|nr:hypothetical protein [Rugamonas sp.]